MNEAVDTVYFEIVAGEGDLGKEQKSVQYVPCNIPAWLSVEYRSR